LSSVICHLSCASRLDSGYLLSAIRHLLFVTRFVELHHLPIAQSTDPKYDIMNKKSGDKHYDDLSRRELLGLAATLTGAGLAAASIGLPQLKASPKQETAHEPLENFKDDLEAREGWAGAGGSAKESTVENLPVATTISGVSMYLKPGALRELHWHAIAAEWGYVVKGNVRTTIISPSGEAGQDDFGPGDVWFFPKGHGHSIQGLGPDEAHFILGFDDGHFSEFGTFSITDWIGHTAPNVLSQNLGLPESAFANFPKGEVYIVAGKVPPAEPAPLREIDPPANQFPHKYRLGAAPPLEFPGGELRIVSRKEFPIQDSMSGATMRIKPGGLREMHWHPNADEWQFYLSGRSRVTIFGAHGRIKSDEFGPGQVAFIKQGFGHFIEQIGDEPTEVLLVFNSPVYHEINISTWLAANPAYLLADNFGITNEMIGKLPRKTVGFAAPGKTE
jgi:oxalate decarboxylase